jgi:hypothetical protein
MIALAPLVACVLGIFTAVTSGTPGEGHVSHSQPALHARCSRDTARPRRRLRLPPLHRLHPARASRRFVGASLHGRSGVLGRRRGDVVRLALLRHGDRRLAPVRDLALPLVRTPPAPPARSPLPLTPLPTFPPRRAVAS